MEALNQGDGGTGAQGHGSNARVPAPHARFLERALPILQSDARLVGVAAGGSYVSGGMDEFSDLDLVIAVEPEALATVLAERQAIAAKLGPLLVGFTGEHVGEPRLLICLYGPPPLHVDLKFVALPDLAQRVEDPVLLWERDGRVSAALAAGVARYPEPDPQWLEDRFWVWIHYGAAKLGRGELFEALGMLTWLQQQVLGPLALRAEGRRPSGVRKIERASARFAADLRATVAAHEPASIAGAYLAAVALYRQLRAAGGPVSARADAEAEAVAYLERALPPEGFFPLVRAQLAELVGVDSRLWPTLWQLLRRPGRLTADWLAGRRTRQMKPISVYALLAGAFFLLHSWRPFIRFDAARRAVDIRLRAVSVFGDLPQRDVDRMAAAGVTLDVFAERFAAAATSLMPAFLLGSVLLFPLGLWVLYRRPARGTATHAVFALHWTAAWLAFTSIDRVLSLGGPVGAAAGSVVSAAAIVWLIVALRRVYGGGWPATIAKGAALQVWFLLLLAAWQASVMFLAIALAN